MALTMGKRKANYVDSNGFFNDDRPTLKRRGTSRPSQDDYNLHQALKQEVRPQYQQKCQQQVQPREQEQNHDRNDSAMSTHCDFYNSQPSTSYISMPPTPPTSTSLIQEEFTSTSSSSSSCSSSPSSSSNPPSSQPPPPPPQEQQKQQTFQSLLQNFCQTQGHKFGPHYLHNLQRSYLEATTTTPPPPPSPSSSNSNPNSSTTTTTTSVLLAGKAFTRTLHLYMSDLQATALAQVQVRATMTKIGVEKSVLEAVDVVLAKLDEEMVAIMTGLQGLEMELNALEEWLESSSRGGGGGEEEEEDVVAML